MLNFRVIAWVHMVRVMNAEQHQMAADLWTKPTDLICRPAKKLHPPSLFIITQPKSWYSFYHLTDGTRLSRPGWQVTYADHLPDHEPSPIQVVTGPRVDSLHHATTQHNATHTHTDNSIYDIYLWEAEYGSHRIWHVNNAAIFTLRDEQKPVCCL